MKVLKFPLLTITISFAIGIIAEYYLEWTFSKLITLLIFCFGAFCFLFWKSKKVLLQNISFGITTYLLAFSLGMLSFYVHSDANNANHYTKNTIEERIYALHSQKRELANMILNDTTENSDLSIEDLYHLIENTNN